MVIENVRNLTKILFPAVLLTFLFLFTSGFVETRQTLAFYRCNDARNIADPLQTDVNNTGLGFFCLVEMSYNVLRSALTLIGVGLLVMLGVGGIRYTTAGGDEKAMQGAKKTLTTAFAGLGIGAVSVFFLTIVVAKIIKPGCDPDDPGFGTCTGDPLQLMIPDYFCTVLGNPGSAATVPPFIINTFCTQK